MNIDLTPEEDAFRTEVRTFFAENMPEALKARVRAGMRLEPAEYIAWQKVLQARGWGAPSWPKVYGGTGWTPTELYIFETEASRADAPVPFHQGLENIGPIIFTYGSDEQKARYLPGIVSGDDWWCQGYSEPGSGSDLASLSTRATLDGDHYVISGQKAWTSYAHVSNRMYLLARTSSEGRKQAGLSLFLIEMDTTPGITIRPVVTMDEVHHTNEAFLDDVRVPASGLLGEEGMGWSYGKVLLDRERAVTAAMATRLAQQLRGARLYAAAARVGEGALLDDPLIADRLAQLELEMMAVESMVLRTMAKAASGQDSGARASMIKIRWSELMQEMTEFWTELQGYDAANFGQVGGEPLEGEGPWTAKAMLWTRVTSIFGGTNEIQRNVIARRALGL